MHRHHWGDRKDNFNPSSGGEIVGYFTEDGMLALQFGITTVTETCQNPKCRKTRAFTVPGETALAREQRVHA